MKTRLLQWMGAMLIALLAASCTTAPYYSADGTAYHSGPQLDQNAVPLIATGVAALALYGYAKERSDRKKRNRYYHDSHYGHYNHYNHYNRHERHRHRRWHHDD